MAISIQKARVLATKPEFTLFRASFPKTLGTLTVAAIKRDVTRARKLRDKYRQLAKKQARSGKEGERTHLKAQMFDEVLVRFQAGLKAAEKATSSKKKPVAKKKTEDAWFGKPAKRTGAAKKKKPQKRGTGPTSKKTTDAAKRSQLDRGGRTRKRTHLSARGKRQQAKRDSKR